MPRKKAQTLIEDVKGTQQVIPVTSVLPALSADDLIQEYFRNDAHIDTENKRFAGYLKPFIDRQEAIKSQLHEKLNAEGQESCKTEHGTAYKSRILNTKIDAEAEPYIRAPDPGDAVRVPQEFRGREAVLEFCLDNWDAIGNELLQIGATKDAVKNYMEQHGKPPPGISTSIFTRINIRKS